MGPEAVSWPVFGGAVLFLMGLNLALDASARAKALVQLSGQPESSLRQTVFGYRAAGFLILAGGLWILFAKRFHGAAPGMSAAGRLAAGLALAASGSFMAAQKFWSGKRFGMGRFLDGEAPAEEPSWSERAAALTGWLVILCLVAYGLVLLGAKKP